MTGWLLSLRDRPITEPHRRGALATVTVLLACATALLILTRPAAHQPITHTGVAAAKTSRSDPPGPARTPASSDDALPPVAVRVSKGVPAGVSRLPLRTRHGGADHRRERDAGAFAAGECAARLASDARTYSARALAAEHARTVTGRGRGERADRRRRARELPHRTAPANPGRAAARQRSEWRLNRARSTC